MLIETTIDGGDLCTTNHGTHQEPFVTQPKRYVFAVNAVAAFEDRGTRPFYTAVDAPYVERSVTRLTFTNGHTQLINMSVGEFIAKMSKAGRMEHANKMQDGDVILLTKEY